MKSEITDISYSTALTFEMVTQYGLLTMGAPTFPSLRKEAIYRTDMNTRGALMFIQYKLSEHIAGTAATLKEDWGIPYYRFLIHPKNRNKRHKLLIHLEDMNTLVYYVAPEFHTKSGLFESLMHKTLLANSTFWSPKAIGSLSPAERNTISFRPNTHHGILEPGKRKIGGAIKGEILLNTIKGGNGADRFERYDEERLFGLGDRMLENYLRVIPSLRDRRLVDDIRKGRNQIDPRDYVSLISIFLYDCYVYIVPG
jgi:hypothetical protein